MKKLLPPGALWYNREIVPPGAIMVQWGNHTARGMVARYM